MRAISRYMYVVDGPPDSPLLFFLVLTVHFLAASASHPNSLPVHKLSRSSISYGPQSHEYLQVVLWWSLWSVQSVNGLPFGASTLKSSHFQH